MKKISVKNIVLLSSVMMIFGTACKKDKVTPTPPPVVTNQSFAQSFDDLDAAKAQGWKFVNLSDDPGTDWTVTDATPNGFTPVDGAGLLYCDYTASNGFTGIISNWAISPKLFVQNGDKISFYAVSHGSIGYGSSGSFGDRLQLRMNIFNGSDEIGTSSTDIGNFTVPLVDINPLYKTSGDGEFPSTFTKFEATVKGLNKPDSARFAIRYFVELNGGSNGDELAVDKFEFKTAGY